MNKKATTSQLTALTDSCQNNPSNVYEVYIPPVAGNAGKIPLLLVIDSHGAGRFAIGKFKTAAKKYPVVLIASDLIKNDFQGFVPAIRSLVEDASKKYPVNGKVFLAGFSGGARMALNYAMTNPVSGLILCGALAQPRQLETLRCPVFSISGLDDFNFIETAQYIINAAMAPKNLTIELTNDSHEWPEEAILANAFGFLMLTQNSANKAATAQFCTIQKERIDSFEKRNELVKAGLIARNMSVYERFNKKTDFKSIYTSLRNLEAYRNQLTQLKKSLRFEMQAREPYFHALQDKDTTWWKNEIKNLEEKAGKEQNLIEQSMYRRIKGFWGIACYSISKEFIATHNPHALNRILAIYKTLEPENPDVYYFSCFPDYWKGNREATVSALIKAREHGFSDLEQMRKDFPDSITRKVP